MATTEIEQAGDKIAGVLYEAKSAGIITDTQVSGQATVTLLKAKIKTDASPASNKAYAEKVCDALDVAVSVGLVTEIHGKADVAALAAACGSSTTRKNTWF